MNKYSRVLLIVFLVVGCVSEKESDKEEIGLPILDIARNLSISVPDTFTWNSIAKSVRLIPLSDKILLSSSWVIDDLSEDLSMNLVSDVRMGRICCIDANGQYKSTFRKVGNGPGEYVYLTKVWFNRRDSVIVIFYNNVKLIKYSKDVKFLKEKLIKERKWGNIHYRDENGFLYTKNGDESNFQVSVLGMNLEVKSNFLSFDSLASSKRKTVIFLNTARSNTVDKYIINRSFSDTVFVVKDDGLRPICVLNKGRHALSEVESENFLRLPKANDYLMYTNIDVFSHYLKYSYMWQGKGVIELWDLSTQKKIASSERSMVDPAEKDKPHGLNFVFDSGNTIKISPIYVTQSRLAFFLPAEDCVGEVEGVKEDDNPVLLVLDLK